MSGPRARSFGPWWLSPAGTVALIVPFTLALAAFNSDGHFRNSWRTAKFVTSADVALFASAAAVFVVGLVWPMLLGRGARSGAEWPGSAGERHTRLTKAAGALFWATMFGYASFLVVGVARGVRPADLITFITKQDAYDSPLRTYFAPVAGLTTFTQVGIAYVIVAALLLKRRRSAKLLRRLGRVVRDDGIDAGIDGIKPHQGIGCRVPGGDLAPADQAGEVGGRVPPEFGHARLLSRCSIVTRDRSQVNWAGLQLCALASRTTPPQIRPMAASFWVPRASPNMKWPISATAT